MVFPRVSSHTHLLLCCYILIVKVSSLPVPASVPLDLTRYFSYEQCIFFYTTNMLQYYDPRLGLRP